MTYEIDEPTRRELGPYLNEVMFTKVYFWYKKKLNKNRLILDLLVYSGFD